MHIFMILYVQSIYSKSVNIGIDVWSVSYIFLIPVLLPQDWGFLPTPPNDTGPHNRPACGSMVSSSSAVLPLSALGKLWKRYVTAVLNSRTSKKKVGNKYSPTELHWRISSWKFAGKDRHDWNFFVVYKPKLWYLEILVRWITASIKHPSRVWILISLLFNILKPLANVCWHCTAKATPNVTPWKQVTDYWTHCLSVNSPPGRPSLGAKWVAKGSGGRRFDVSLAFSTYQF